MSIAIISSLLLMQAAPADTAEPMLEDVQQEIVVIAERLKDWKGRLGKDDTGLSCETTKSSGDAQVDAIRCDAMIACFTPIEDAMDAAYASDDAAPERRARINALVETTVPCISDYERQAAIALAEERAGV
ncbi:hypothetical protein GRI38_12730 [Altererythrobacter aurantiacus]|uniref:UrcA family protein n=1 Tax=Parapontixanthobacter aurantiacus TaxID=1463599 RepID=A0A844ZHJ9_9SPHN|nr:hypothetical protein [Parapontixanthobacter aurantiacus]MXO86893.1 hypothetical protein [Parapontixanthobacter aurantiacus]